MVKETKPAGNMHGADEKSPQWQRHSLSENLTIVERLPRWILKVSGSSLHNTFQDCPGGIFRSAKDTRFAWPRRRIRNPGFSFPSGPANIPFHPGMAAHLRMAICAAVSSAGVNS
jgi:hypothetical protein